MKYLEAKKRSAQPETKALGGPPENKASRSVSGITPSSSSAAKPSGPQASPQARQLATEQGIDLATVTGTGVGGMITAGDVRQAIESKGRQD